jgi:hypothetical protein
MNLKNKNLIKIYFTDFWSYFEPEHFFIYNIFNKKYQIIIDGENPDYLFFSCFGNDHLDYNHCVKIYYTGENLFPDFNLCDYAIGFPHLQLEDRFLRIPEWATHTKDSLFSKSIPDPEIVVNRKFCNFVYSNNSESADPFRLRFFHRLSEYKRVDSGGKTENNIGGPVTDKLDFISRYKFTIAFENSSVSGYTTEKLIEPMLAGSLPVYWGNPSLELDFNTDAIVYVKDDQSMDKAIMEIIALDNDDDAYLKKLEQPWFKNNEYEDWEKKVECFLDRIFTQEKKTAFRRTRYGWNYYYADL